MKEHNFSVKYEGVEYYGTAHGDVMTVTRVCEEHEDEKITFSLRHWAGLKEGIDHMATATVKPDSLSWGSSG